MSIPRKGIYGAGTSWVPFAAHFPSSHRRGCQSYWSTSTLYCLRGWLPHLLRASSRPFDSIGLPRFPRRLSCNQYLRGKKIEEEESLALASTRRVFLWPRPTGGGSCRSRRVAAPLLVNSKGCASRLTGPRRLRDFDCTRRHAHRLRLLSAGCRGSGTEASEFSQPLAASGK
jgi:hypothetical protein